MVTSPPADPMAATAPPRGKPHPPISAPLLKTWGSRRLVRFRRGDAADGGRRRSATAVRESDRHPLPAPEPADGGSGGGDDDWGLKELREKLLGQLREAADKMKLVGASFQAEESESEAVPPAGEACVTEERRRVCRSPVRSGGPVSSLYPRREVAAARPECVTGERRTSCKSPVRSGGNVSSLCPRGEERQACVTGERRRSCKSPVRSGGHVSSLCPRGEEAAAAGERRRRCRSPVRFGGHVSSPCPRACGSPVRSACPREAEAAVRSARLRAGRGKGMRARFSVRLTREEIEEDVYSLTGSRPGGRPKKRPRHVQRLVDSLLPGMWLTEITADSYKVAG